MSEKSPEIERTLDGLSPLNAGQLKKYKVTINDLLEANSKLEARAEASEKGKLKDAMERVQQVEISYNCVGVIELPDTNKTNSKTA